VWEANPVVSSRVDDLLNVEATAVLPEQPEDCIEEPVLFVGEFEDDSVLRRDNMEYGDSKANRAFRSTSWKLAGSSSCQVV